MQDLHGGKIHKYENILDFSSNINPLGTPEGVKNAVIEAVETCHAYPDMKCHRLREMLSERRNAKVSEVICGNGATELIYSLIQALKPKKALLAVPSFAEYEGALKALQCQIEYYDTSINEFILDEGYIAQITEDIDLVMLCNPGNPVGNMISSELLNKIIEKCAKTGTFVFVDECFIDFTLSGFKESIWPCENVFILNSFTKMYAIPGIRAGYGICKNQDVLEKMLLNLPAWNMSSLAQAAAKACLLESAFENKSREYIKKEREFLQKELEGFECKCYKSMANFIFFRAPNGNVHLKEKLLNKGILIRDCSNYRGITPGYYRIAVKTHQENIRLIEALGSIDFE